MKIRTISALITAMILTCQPYVVSAEEPYRTSAEWMQYLEQELNPEDYGVTESAGTNEMLPIVGNNGTDSSTIKIMIDPGHYGYYNPSTVVSGYYESVMTWTLSNYLKEELEALGVQADLTKTSLQDNPDLQPRGHMSAGYDFFLSIHSNASSYSSVDYPVAICYQNLSWTTIDDTSREVGQILTDTVTRVMGTKQKGIIWQRLSDNDRDGNGVKDDEWYGVLCGARYVGTPGVLMEHSFHTNYSATVWLMQDSNLHLLAKEEAAALADYFQSKKAEENPTTSSEERKAGDVDGDGALTVEDAVQILSYYAQESANLTPDFPDEISRLAADYDGDNAITVEDAVEVLRCYAEEAAGLQPTYRLLTSASE
jgi:N-acetylmuramoyl-L-alanine amidase